MSLKPQYFPMIAPKENIADNDEINLKHLYIDSKKLKDDDAELEEEEEEKKLKDEDEEEELEEDDEEEELEEDDEEEELEEDDEELIPKPDTNNSAKKNSNFKDK